MIRVEPALPPPNFDRAVRQKGLDAIAELVGEIPSQKRRGPKRKAAAQYATREAIPPGRFPDYWTAVIPDLRERYLDRCAYLALHLFGPGGASVDHFVPKSSDWHQVYEWSNYRLCHPFVNGHRGTAALHFDPFTLEPELFAMEFVEYQVVARPGVDAVTAKKLDDDVHHLGLNEGPCRKARRAYVEDYRLGPPKGIALEYLEGKAPFIASELRRQGLLVRGDR